MEKGTITMFECVLCWLGLRNWFMDEVLKENEREREALLRKFQTSY